MALNIEWETETDETDETVTVIEWKEYSDRLRHQKLMRKEKPSHGRKARHAPR